MMVAFSLWGGGGFLSSFFWWRKWMNGRGCMMRLYDIPFRMIHAYFHIPLYAICVFLPRKPITLLGSLRNLENL